MPLPQTRQKENGRDGRASCAHVPHPGPMLGESSGVLRAEVAS